MLFRTTIEFELISCGTIRFEILMSTASFVRLILVTAKKTGQIYNVCQLFQLHVLIGICVEFCVLVVSNTNQSFVTAVSDSITNTYTLSV